MKKTKTIKTQLYDKIHNVISNYNDRMVHALYQYDFVIDEDILKKVLKSFFDSSPILHSSFKACTFRHKWVVRDYSIDDVFSSVYCEDIEKAADDFLCGVIPADFNVQIKVRLFIYKGKSAVGIITNHMCMDGGDLKYFIKTMCDAYNAISLGKDDIPLLKSGSRCYKAVYKDFSFRKKLKALSLFRNPTPKNTLSFPLSADTCADKAFIIKKDINPLSFEKLKSFGKAQGATVNDMILTAYFCALKDFINCDDDEEITVSGAIDLRRYMKNKDLTGITNHSSYLPYTLKGSKETFKDTLRKVINISKAYKADPYTGLYGLPLLNFGYSFFPAFIADKLVKRFYNNPYIALSNIGILKEENYRLSGKSPDSAFITGTVKYKPGIMLTATTYKSRLTLTMCTKGTETDRKKLINLMDKIGFYLNNFNS